MRRVHVLTGALILAVLSTAAGPAGAQGTDDATIASVKTTYEVVKGYITKAAAQVPEDTYKFQPTKEVRTMGQLFGHIANSNGMICGTASGMKPASSGDAEKLATKAEIQKALADSFAACDHAFSMINPANANEPVKLFGMAHTRIGAMAFNNAHDFEHYGNIVTYMRINKMVPPSSGGKD
jgi:uncharacterized damage-inducible protein DinB